MKFEHVGWVVAAGIGGSIVASGFQAPTTKIGVVDVGKVFNDSEYAKTQAAALQQTVDARSTMLEFVKTYRLFTPEVIAALGKSSIIIETHPFETGDDNAALALAFAPTHSVHTIPFIPNSRRLPKKFSALLSGEEFAMATDEGRCAESEWLWAKPLPEVR